MEPFEQGGVCQGGVAQCWNRLDPDLKTLNATRGTVRINGKGLFGPKQYQWIRRGQSVGGLASFLNAGSRYGVGLTRIRAIIPPSSCSRIWQ